MAGRCPYLRLESIREQGLEEPGRRHRCYVRFRPERVGLAHQANTCLTSGYRRCPRLTVARGAGGQRSKDTGRGSPETQRPYDLAPLRPCVPVTSRRPITLTEILVLGLGMSTLFALLFVGYAVVYRLRIGPGMAAAPLVARGPQVAIAQALPSLVPTFTPTLAPTLPQILLATTPVATHAPPTPSPEPTRPTPTPIVRPPADSPPTRLVIPKIHLDIPVLAVGIKTIRKGGKTTVVWADVPHGGGFHRTSAYPGNPGNTVINGHRDILGSVFRHLDRLEVGDEIIVYVGDVAYPYRVTETLVVPETFASAEQRAENLRLIGYMPEERLTLVTCTPVGLATHRLLVIAKPPAQTVPQMPEAGATVGP